MVENVCVGEGGGRRRPSSELFVGNSGNVKRLKLTANLKIPVQQSSCPNIRSYIIHYPCGSLMSHKKRSESDKDRTDLPMQPVIAFFLTFKAFRIIAHLTVYRHQLIEVSSNILLFLSRCLLLQVVTCFTHTWYCWQGKLIRGKRVISWCARNTENWSSFFSRPR